MKHEMKQYSELEQFDVITLDGHDWEVTAAHTSIMTTVQLRNLATYPKGQPRFRTKIVPKDEMVLRVQTAAEHLGERDAYRRMVGREEDVRELNRYEREGGV